MSPSRSFTRTKRPNTVTALRLGLQKTNVPRSLGTIRCLIQIGCFRGEISFRPAAWPVPFPTFLLLLQAYLSMSYRKWVRVILWHTSNFDMSQAYILLFEAPIVVKRRWASYVDRLPPGMIPSMGFETPTIKNIRRHFTRVIYSGRYFICGRISSLSSPKSGFACPQIKHPPQYFYIVAPSFKGLLKLAP